MKKTIALLLVTAMFLTSCGGKDEPAVPKENPSSSSAAAGNTADPETEEDEIPAPGQIEVDEGLLNVTINIPASFYEGADPADVVSRGEANGMKVTPEADGSYTMTMPKAQHSEFMARLTADVEEAFEEIISGGTFASISDIEIHERFKELSLIVDREAFDNSLDAFAVMGIMIQVQGYNIMNGTPDEKTTIHLVDAQTGETYNTAVYPDAWND